MPHFSSPLLSSFPLQAQAQGPVLGGVAPSGASLPAGVLQPEAKRRREEVMAFDQAALNGGGGA